MLLAKKGHSVLVVDRSTFPSDIMSTHYIQPEGVSRLQEWGLYDKLMATNCPSIPRITFTVSGVTMPAPPAPEGTPEAVCPRRTVLDKILVDAARDAGAEVREGFSVQDILFEAGAVVGVKGRASDGANLEERARVTVGADGQHSIVARAVSAPEYDTHPALTCGYYSYFSGVPMPENQSEGYTGNGAGVLAFPTNDGLTCIGAGTDITRFHEFRGDIDGKFFELLDAAAPELARRVRAGKRVERWIGTADTENFFRQPFGPGWALCGDAGYHKDFITGLGISDAFRDAEFLSDALDAGLSDREPLQDALAAYQKRRDEAAKPMYEATVFFASFPTMEEMMQAMTQQAAQQAGANTEATPAG
jgi:flavin-dependent dehydrogenase